MLGTFHDWDERFREAPEQAAAEPAPIVAELLPLLPPGRALDLACGAGRHSLLLAGQGYTTTGVDLAAAGLALAEERAQKVGIAVRRTTRLESPKHRSSGGITLVQADLEATRLPADSFEVIVCLNYLQRSLFPQMEQALRRRGMLVFETFTRAHLEFGAGPRNPEFLLESHELRTAFPTLRTIFYRELRAGKGIASLLAEKSA
jgi:SAM-dependent methyltransferase